MMDTIDRLPRELVTTSTTAALAQRLTTLPDQSTAVQVRALVALCQQMSQQYQNSSELCLERSWWQMFNQAGIRLHEALDQAKVEGYQGLSDQEAERAYFLLIHVAYFFTPGGIAETVWPMLPGDKQTEPSANEALGVVFGSRPQARQHVCLHQQVSYWKQRLGQILGKCASDGRGAVVLRELITYDPPPLEEEAAGFHPLETRRPADGAHPGG